MAISLGTATLSKMYLGVSEITKAYLGATQIFGGTTVDTYAANGISPEFVADFVNDYYRVASNDSTFASALTFSRSGNATMVDSDGLIKWAPHNLVLNSGSPATQSITVVSGADYTVECTGLGSVALSGAGTGTVSSGAPVEITASTTTLTLTVLGTVETMWAYRSDLGGMVDNPETSNSYVPTTGTARYLSRLGHHVYNGTSWVNEGVLIESEARTNIFTTSEDLDPATTDWEANNVTITATTDINGNNNAWNIIPSLGDTFHRLNSRAMPGLPTTAVTASVYAKADGYNYMSIRGDNGSGTFDQVGFDLTGSGSITHTGTGMAGTIEQLSGGWFRCSAYFNRATAPSLPEITFCVSNASVTTSSIPRFAGDGTSGIEVYAPQLEQASTPSSYIPTSGSTVPRAADSLTIAAADAPYSATAMSIQVSGKQTGDSYTMTRWLADASNYITLESGTNDFTFEQANGGTVDSVTGGSFTSGVNVDYNIASRNGTTFINGAVSGTALTEDTTPTALPSLSTNDVNLGYDFMGTISLFRMWDQDIGDTGIEEAST